MATDLLAILQELTAQPATAHPYLSVYIDYTPDGNGKRPSLRALEQELDQIGAHLTDQGGDMDSFNADRQRITDYLDDKAPKDASGLAIFACYAEEVWLALPLQVPVATEVFADRTPHLFTLARLHDDYETCAVVVADSQESSIFVVALNSAIKVGGTEATEEIRRVDAGGPSQMILQRRTENLIKAQTKDMAEELGKIVQRYGIKRVIISSSDSIKGTVMSSLPGQLKALVVNYINLPAQSSIKEIMQAIEPLLQQAERQQEANDLTRLEDQVGAVGGMGVVGIAETALALSKGQVQTLLIHQSFSGDGGECPNCGTLRAGKRTNCPYDGVELQPVDLREAFTARALQQSADVQVVEASPYLDQHEGVGALLRYRDDTEDHEV